MPRVIHKLLKEKCPSHMLIDGTNALRRMLNEILFAHRLCLLLVSVELDQYSFFINFMGIDRSAEESTFNREPLDPLPKGHRKFFKLLQPS